MTLGRIVASSIDGVRTVELDGLRNEELPVTQESACDLGSITKIVATTSILMKLIEKRVISLDDDVTKFLPEWGSYPKVVTLRDLLEHQSASLNGVRSISHRSRQILLNK